MIFDVRGWNKSELSLIVLSLLGRIFVILRLHEFLLHILHLLLILFHVSKLAFQGRWRVARLRLLLDVSDIFRYLFVADLL